MADGNEGKPPAQPLTPTDPVGQNTAKRGIAKDLDSVDNALLQLLSIDPVMTDVALGKKLGINRKTVLARRKKPAFKAAMFELTLDVQALLKRAARRAVRFEERVIGRAEADARGDATQDGLNAAQDVLDRALGPRHKPEINIANVNANASPEGWNGALQKAKEVWDNKNHEEAEGAKGKGKRRRARGTQKQS